MRMLHFTTHNPSAKWENENVRSFFFTISCRSVIIYVCICCYCYINIYIPITVHYTNTIVGINYRILVSTLIAMNRSTLYFDCVLGMIINYKWNMKNIFLLSVFRIHPFAHISAKQKQWKYNTNHEEQLCQWMFIRRVCLCIDWKHESCNLIKMLSLLCFSYITILSSQWYTQSNWFSS